MSDDSPEVETLEALQVRHRKEQRDLVSRITQKKKQASKKTRKGVNDECDRWERDQKERQEREIAALNGEVADTEVEIEDEIDIKDDIGKKDDTDLNEDLAKLELNGGANTKKPNRAKARLARRAAEQDALVREAEREAANAPNPREIERERMAIQLERHKLALHEIKADGHCLYAAVADQLHTRELGLKPKITVKVLEEGNGADAANYKKVRYAAADWIEGHADDFAGFMEDPFPEHVRKIRETGSGVDMLNCLLWRERMGSGYVCCTVMGE
ncbi:hypothetical protein GQ44DRAFT_731033 [Phaeosphaeriaceae sp. PMI808]|nr:hypothetical protein GQ44DRAFT_731033 [Phaeosphaeriaceae sp. PMI808]